ncbi:hypothetical protein AAAC51_35645 [Priestia megaterium]
MGFWVFNAGLLCLEAIVRRGIQAFVKFRYKFSPAARLIRTLIRKIPALQRALLLFLNAGHLLLFE